LVCRFLDLLEWSIFLFAELAAKLPGRARRLLIEDYIKVLAIVRDASTKLEASDTITSCIVPSVLRTLSQHLLLLSQSHDRDFSPSVRLFAKALHDALANRASMMWTTATPYTVAALLSPGTACAIDDDRIRDSAVDLFVADGTQFSKSPYGDAIVPARKKMFIDVIHLYDTDDIAKRLWSKANGNPLAFWRLALTCEQETLNFFANEMAVSFRILNQNAIHLFLRRTMFSGNYQTLSRDSSIQCGVGTPFFFGWNCGRHWQSRADAL
jgi:hypothetical protein